MILKKFSLGLAIVTLTLCWSVTTLAQQAKVITYKPPDCEPVKAIDDGSYGAFSIYVNDQSILVESSKRPESFLITADSLIKMNQKGKYYSLASYEELKAIVNHQSDKFLKHQERIGRSVDRVEMRRSGETEIISGERARKLMLMVNDKLEGEIWVSPELVPMGLQEKGKSIYMEGERRRSLMKPDLIEIIMMYGMPLKIISWGKTACQAQVHEDSNINKPLEVPADYRKITKVN
jgi:hypothetical protein